MGSSLISDPHAGGKPGWFIIYIYTHSFCYCHSKPLWLMQPQHSPHSKLARHMVMHTIFRCSLAPIYIYVYVICTYIYIYQNMHIIYISSSGNLVVWSSIVLEASLSLSNICMIRDPSCMLLLEGCFTSTTTAGKQTSISWLKNQHPNFCSSSHPSLTCKKVTFFLVLLNPVNYWVGARWLAIVRISQVAITVINVQSRKDDVPKCFQYIPTINIYIHVYIYI
jgi:hypothetical protein